MKINSNQVNSYNTILKNTFSKTPTAKAETRKVSTDTVELNSFQDRGKMKEVIRDSLQNGLSLVQTMDKALEKAEGIGENLKKIAITYQKSSGEQKENIKKEATELFSDLGKVLKNATHNGESVFDKANYSIFTGGKSTYNIKTANVSSLTKLTDVQQVKAEVPINSLNLTNTLSQNVSNNVLNLSLLQTVSSVSTQPINVEDYLSPTPTTIQKESVSTESSRSVAESTALTETAVTTKEEQANNISEPTNSATSNSQSKKNQKLTKEEQKEVQDTLNKVLGSKKETREFFGVKNEKELMEVLEQETAESLQNKFLEKGYTEEYQQVIKEGLFEKLGLENPMNQKPTEPIKDSEEDGKTEGTPTKPGSQDGKSPEESSGIPSGSSNPLDLSTLLDLDSIQKNILDILEVERKFLDIHKSMLSSMLNREQTLVETQSKGNMNQPTTYDIYHHVSKINVEKLKSYNLTQFSNAMTFNNFTLQK